MTEAEARDHEMAEWLRGFMSKDRARVERAEVKLIRCSACNSDAVDPWISTCGFCSRDYLADTLCEDCDALIRVEGGVCHYCHRSYCDRCKKPGESSECKPCGDIRDDEIGAEAILRNAIREAVRA